MIDKNNKLTAQRRCFLVAGTLMVSSAVLAQKFKPQEKMADSYAGVKLEAVVPKSFGNWQIVESKFTGIVNPQQQELLDSLYSQILGRSYTNQTGDFVMLSLAYGEEQTGEAQLHRPEVCYVAQGFKIERQKPSVVNLPELNLSIPAQHLLAINENRKEPITYWVRIGDDIVASGTSQRLSRARHGITGRIPDGILFRVSSLTEDLNIAYKLQEGFIRDILNSVDPVTRHFLAGPGYTPLAQNKP